MGRKKIKIKTIENERQKNVTFSRRRCGLIKKAHELAVLCECKVVLMMFDAKDACHIYSSVDDPEGLIEKYYRKEFKTVDNRRRKSAPNTSSDSMNKPAIVNEYKISTNGEGSENIQVKHTKNEHNPGAVLLSLNAEEGMSYGNGFPDNNCSNYEYLLDDGGVGYRDTGEQNGDMCHGLDYSSIMDFQSQPPPQNPRLSRHFSYPSTLGSQIFYDYPHSASNPSIADLEHPSMVMSMPMAIPNGWNKRQNSFQY
ncbi:hypothetical protein K7432_007474 [Basidiobolus ranarum]|uniref:MADS-box domain-containing protein n=1 Tax=Basidiobolus ranarum TaxID=34480 RepID=A0ABR2WTE5_9FUNG